MEEKIELRSEEVQELMGEVPGWILRWGIGLIAIVLSLLLAGSCFFKYPEVITADIIVTTVCPPVELYSKATGKIEYVNAEHERQVDISEVLAVIESTARFEDVIFVKNCIERWRNGTYDNTCCYSELQKMALSMGDVQGALSQFVTALDNLIRYNNEVYYPQKIALKERQQGIRERKNNIQAQERALHRTEDALSEKLFQRDSILFAQKLISEEDYNMAEQTLLQSRHTKLSDANTREQENLEFAQEDELLLDLNHQQSETKATLENELKTATENLDNAIQQYLNIYVLSTPVAGKISMMGKWQKNMYVDAGTLMMMVLPDGKPTSTGRAKLPAAGAGKVCAGQKVRVRLSNFPDSEYGYVLGVVAAISAIPEKDGNYYVEVSFPNGLATNYDKILPQSQQMMGTAEIVVKDKRLIENFIQPLEKIIRQ